MNPSKDVLKESLPYEDTSRAIFSGSDWETIGKSANNHNITGKLLKSAKKGKNALLIGGVHGNETEGVRFMEDFVREFGLHNAVSPLSCNIYLVPVFNPDGFLEFKRGNGNNVDLNRNMPTKDWSDQFSEQKYYPGSRACSEPETEAMINLLVNFKPDFIISFHSWKPMININGPAMPFAEAMKKNMNMDIVEDIGYPTPGSLGTYAGWERKIPTITLEFERGLALESIYPNARQAVLDCLATL